MNTSDRATDVAMRGDGRRNRDQLMDAARATFATDGVDASLREVARRAGVNIATLYRHFPNREALLEAVVRDLFDHLTARADTLTDADDGLFTWMCELVDALNTYSGLPGAVQSSLQDLSSPLHEACSRLGSAAANLLTSARDAGRVRPDLQTHEILATANAAAWLGQPPIGLSPHRFLTLFTEGWHRHS
ncbi:TetR/AcrR family transcriptional regulator [Nocardia sp. NPDC052278]|uniref:TetR/AcrR family transcriptional regulator n=1 Tax=unclassified Nocardia TaxID=2637762 RepID=UPI0036A48EEC